MDLTDLAIFFEAFLECTDPIGQDCQQFWNEPALAVYLTLDEASGSIAFDSSIYGKDGTLVNMDPNDWVAGYDGNALDFDGVDEHVVITGYKGVVGTISRSISAWESNQRPWYSRRPN